MNGSRPLVSRSPRFELLRLLAFRTRQGQLPLGKLGVRLQVHPTSITSAVDRLEVQGFVERQRHPTDGRTTLAVITRAGRRTVERATTVLNDEVFVDLGLSPNDTEALYRCSRRCENTSNTWRWPRTLTVVLLAIAANMRERF